MKKLIAMAGKGGTGKTTLAALIIRALKDEAGSLLAIDADPNHNLWQWLGLKRNETVMDIVEGINKNSGSMPPGITKQRYIDFKIQESLEESNFFDLLSMGRPEGPGCYCYANNLLRDTIEKLARNSEFVVVANEAGMEHLSRRLKRKISSLFITSDFSVIGLRSAKNISILVDSLDIKVDEKFLVLNRVSADALRLQTEIDKTGLRLAGLIPYDENLEKISVEGGSIFDLEETSPAVKAMKGLTKSLKGIPNTVGGP